MYNLVSFAGIFILMAFAWMLSADRKVVNWRVIIWGTGIQLVFAFFIFIVPVGADLFMFINDALSGINMDWSLKGLLGYIFYPFTLIIGVPFADAFEISKIIGERTIVTETKSYMDLAVLMDSGGLKDPRSAFLATYALCGFAHVASLAIFVGGTAALVPERTADLSAVGPRALLAATLACLMTAAVAGTFYNGGSILLGQ